MSNRSQSHSFDLQVSSPITPNMSVFSRGMDVSRLQTTVRSLFSGAIAHYGNLATVATNVPARSLGRKPGSDVSAVVMLIVKSVIPGLTQPDAAAVASQLVTAGGRSLAIAEKTLRNRSSLQALVNTHLKENTIAQLMINHPMDVTIEEFLTGVTWDTIGDENNSDRPIFLEVVAAVAAAIAVKDTTFKPLDLALQAISVLDSTPQQCKKGKAKKRKATESSSDEEDDNTTAQHKRPKGCGGRKKRGAPRSVALSESSMLAAAAAAAAAFMAPPLPPLPPPSIISPLGFAPPAGDCSAQDLYRKWSSEECEAEPEGTANLSEIPLPSARALDWVQFEVRSLPAAESDAPKQQKPQLVEQVEQVELPNAGEGGGSFPRLTVADLLSFSYGPRNCAAEKSFLFSQSFSFKSFRSNSFTQEEKQTILSALC